MKAYKYDFDGEKFIMIEFDIDHKFDFTKEPETSLANNRGQHHCSKNIMEKAVKERNENMVNEITEDSPKTSIMVKKCKDCGKYFIINYNEYIWFKNRDLKIPVRCNECRDRRKYSGK